MSNLTALGGMGFLLLLGGAAWGSNDPGSGLFTMTAGVLLLFADIHNRINHLPKGKP